MNEKTRVVVFISPYNVMVWQHWTGCTGLRQKSAAIEQALRWALQEPPAEGQQVDETVLPKPSGQHVMTTPKNHVFHLDTDVIREVVSLYPRRSHGRSVAQVLQDYAHTFNVVQAVPANKLPVDEGRRHRIVVTYNSLPAGVRGPGQGHAQLGTRGRYAYWVACVYGVQMGAVQQLVSRYNRKYTSKK
jgi:hypothetical protein